MLSGLVEDAGGELPEGSDEIVDLADFAVQFRYEAFDDLGELLDRPRLAALVRKLVEHVGSLTEGTRAD